MAAPQLKEKPSGIWFVEFEGENGERRRVSTNTRNKDAARAKMRDIVLGLDKPIQQSQKAEGPTGVTMSALFDRMLKTVWAPGEVKSQATVLSHVKILTELIGNEAAKDMTYTRLEQLIATLKERGNSPGSIKRKMDSVSKTLRMATIWTDDKGRPLLPAKPTMPTIRVANLKDRVVHNAADVRLLGGPDEETAIFQAIEKRRLAEPERPWFRVAALVRFLFDVGSRLGETLNLGPQDVRMHPVLQPDGSVVQRPVAVFPRYSTKNDKPRQVPLTDAAWAALQSQRDHLGRRKGETKAVFFPIRAASVWYMFDQIKKDLSEKGIDLSDVTLHTLRHTCLTRLARGGLDLLRIKEWAGHSDIKITAERYAHLIPSNLMDGLLLLGSSNGGTPPIKEENDVSPANVIITQATAIRGGSAASLPN